MFSGMYIFSNESVWNDFVCTESKLSKADCIVSLENYALCIQEECKNTYNHTVFNSDVVMQLDTHSISILLSNVNTQLRVHGTFLLIKMVGL
jgi:hypothetical protein